MGSTPSSAEMVARGALLSSLALLFSYVEAMIPFVPQIPGIKLGLANIVVIIALYRYSARTALVVNLVRIFLAGFLFSGVFGILYSAAGALLSLLVMTLLKKSGRFHLVSISMAGGVFHNVGQLIVASLLVGTSGILSYLPVLWFVGMGMGSLVGVLDSLILTRLPRGNTAANG